MSANIPTRIEGDVYVAGNLASKTQTLAAGSVDDTAVAAGAGIAASKLEHQHRTPFSQPNTAATSETRVVYRCNGEEGTIFNFSAGSIAKAVGDSTVTVDLKKNGTTVLTAPITLNSSNTARVAVGGTLSVTDLVAGDVLEVVTVATIGTGTLPTGVFASITTIEDAA